jgi:protein-S-isoprenylcysteine O-methyltransferase Ste14
MPTEIDLMFRNVMLVGAVIIIPIVAYYRVLSNATKEKLDRRQEGVLLAIGIRLSGLLGAIGVIAFMINPANMSWASVAVPLWLRWVGVGIAMFGGCLWIHTFRHLGRNLTDTVVTRIKHSLVTSGPYRWVRHPFYVSLALLAIANSLATANWFIAITLSSTFALLVVRTDREEQRLIDRFGDAYRDYMHRVNRFIPKFF